MLSLGRRIGESIFIGDDIKLLVLGIKGDQVRLGVEAEKTTPIVRHEDYIKALSQAVGVSEPASEKLAPVEPAKKAIFESAGPIVKVEKSRAVKCE